VVNINASSGTETFYFALGTGNAIFVVDDEPPVRKTVSHLLANAGYDVQDFDSAERFLAYRYPSGPSCLLDLWLPGMTGIDLQKRCSEDGFDAEIIFMSGQGDIVSCSQAFRAGAVDFLSKPFTHTELLTGVERALTRSNKRYSRSLATTEVKARLASLTPRELDVLIGVTAGMLNKQIAAALGIAEQTVKIHRGRVMKKMKAASLAQLIQISSQMDDILNRRNGIVGSR
jgi:FixJ family two-component response regulator